MAGSIFRRRIEATEDTDVQSAVDKLRSDAAHVGVSAFAIDSMDAQFRESIKPLISHGKTLRALGSHLEAERKLEGPGYAVTLIFRVGMRPSLVKRIARRLGMR